MEYLITQLALELKARKFKPLSLGMAPLAGLVRTPLSSRWNRMAGLVWEHGRTIYNFQGLRSFKNKFRPVWEPRYLAASGAVGPFITLADVATLASGDTGEAPPDMIGLSRALGRIVIVCCPWAPTAYAFDPGRYGSVKVAEPKITPRGMVILFSDRNGLSKTDAAAAETIAKGGAAGCRDRQQTYLRISRSLMRRAISRPTMRNRSAASFSANGSFMTTLRRSLPASAKAGRWRK